MPGRRLRNIDCLKGAIMAKSKSRRDFLADSVAGLGSVWLATHWPAILEAEGMKEPAVQGSAGLAAVTSSPKPDGRVDALLNQREPNADKWGLGALEQRRRRTRDHLARIAARAASRPS